MKYIWKYLNIRDFWKENCVKVICKLRVNEIIGRFHTFDIQNLNFLNALVGVGITCSYEYLHNMFIRCTNLKFSPNPSIMWQKNHTWLATTSTIGRDSHCEQSLKLLNILIQPRWNKCTKTIISNDTTATKINAKFI